ncbi:MAG: LysM peptidoglycan-binding domain-containing protein [Bacteroidales bacterium]|nr:LysM peptidoglycan-binding domain-containing protein [Bacteroidales bacterium]
MAKSGYYFYLEDCRLPVAPESLQIKVNNANKTVTLMNEGEINILKTPGLSDIEFTCLLPHVEYPFASYSGSFRKPSYYLEYFEDLKESKQPFQFIVSRYSPSGKSLHNTDITVSMEDYTITEDAEDGNDISVKIKLKSYRYFGTKTVKIVQEEDTSTATLQQARETSSSPEPTQNTTYTVVSGDCLWNIAKKFYGDGSQYTVIYDANRDVVGSNPNLIYPGQVLTIPAIS